MAKRQSPMSMNAVIRVTSGFGKIVVTLALMPPKSLLDERAIAEMLGVPMRTVRRMVVRNELPPPEMLAGKSTWIAHDIMAQIKARPDLAAFFVKREARRIEALAKCAPSTKALQSHKGSSSGLPSGSEGTSL